MKVVLNSDVDNLGRKGDVVEVAAGYARNFLLPRRLALFATKGAVRQAEQMQRARREREARERAAAEELAQKIGEAALKISAKAGDEGHLFGSVTTSDIAEKLGEVIGQEVDRRRVELAEPIRSVGVHDFSVRLHPEVQVAGSIEVVPEQ